MTKKQKLKRVCENALKVTSSEVVKAYLNNVAKNKRVKASDEEIDGYIDEINNKYLKG